MNTLGGHGPRPRFAARAALCAVAAAAVAAGLPARAQQPTQPPAPQSTNLGTLVVAPQNAPPPVTGAASKLQIQRSSLDLNIQSGPPAHGSGAAHAPASTPPRPLRVVPPRYPRRAYERQVSGAVTVAFTVKPNGRTARIRIVKAEPPRVFNAAARAAVREWRFQPATRNGKPVAMEVTETLDFTPPAAARTPRPKPPQEHAGAAPHEAVASKVEPTHIVAPRYPARAYQSGQGGSVTVQFTVLPDGRTADIRVLEASPPTVFNAAAIAAVRQWRFRPLAGPKRVVQTIQFTPPDH